MNVKIGQMYKHEKSGKLVTVLGLPEIKVTDIWIPGVLYLCENQKTYARPLEIFVEKFVEGETE